jgi:hypothetical protein
MAGKREMFNVLLLRFERVGRLGKIAALCPELRGQPIAIVPIHARSASPCAVPLACDGMCLEPTKANRGQVPAKSGFQQVRLHIAEDLVFGSG